MANEDSRDNSVVGGALKLATIGAMVYGGYRGGRSLIKNYDDLGKVLGKTGDKMSNGIKKGLSMLDNSDGGNIIREGLDNMQNKILSKDFQRSIDKTDKFLLSPLNLERTEESKNILHDAFKGLDVGNKRELIKNRSDDLKSYKKAFKESGTKNLKEFITGNESIGGLVDGMFNKGDIQAVGSNTKKL